MFEDHGSKPKGGSWTDKELNPESHQNYQNRDMDVRTLFQTGKMAQTIRQFGNYGLDVLGLTELRWGGSGKIMDSETTLLYSGPNESHERGVNIMLNKEASKTLIGWNPVNDRIITARLKTKHSRKTVVTAFAPNEDSDEYKKDEFFQQCQDVLNDIPRSDIVIFLCDLNAQIGKNRQGSEHVIGPLATANARSYNGGKLLMFCNIN